MKVKNPFRRVGEAAPVARPKAQGPELVWASPVDYNRAVRRSVGLFGRIWKWNPQQATPLSRYVRRHFSEATFTHPKTRRQRRHRARIMRDMRVAK